MYIYIYNHERRGGRKKSHRWNRAFQSVKEQNGFLKRIDG